jgi:menaquinone-dependent protoporphyrinogen oxidase
MSSKILVAYASKYGSTREVAEAIARALTPALIGCGLAVDLRPLREVRTVDEYCAVVMGAPLYMFRWHKDAHGFLCRHREALANLPAAVFALGPWNDKAEEWQEVRSELDKELARHPWFSPIAIKVVGGRFDPARLTLPWSLVPALRNRPPSDIRDWDAIRSWAQELAARFERVQA